MTTTDPLAAVRGGLTDFQRGDIPALLARLHDDIVWKTPFPADVMPYGGTRHGKTQVADVFQKLGENIQITQFDLHEFVNSGDTVVAIGTYEIIVKPTGIRAGADFVMVFHVRDGKIAAFREYSDPTPSIAAFRGVSVARDST